QASAWIDADLSVVRAHSVAQAAGHGGAAVAASPYEWTTRVQGQRRRYQDTGVNSAEWAVQLERTIRINGKAGLDRHLRDVEDQIGRARVAEARHESARALADMWSAVVVAERQRALLDEQVSFARGNVDAVKKRMRAGDASALDVNVAQADLGDVQREASAAVTALTNARAALRSRFPSAAPEASPLPEPHPALLTEPAWRERVIGESETVEAAQGEYEKSTLTARRTRADRVPDPTVGVFAATEARRNEKIIGLSVSIPFSGTYRSERALQAGKEADAAHASLLRAKLDADLDATQTYSEAQGSLERWRIAQDTARLATENARLMQRTYTLGEADLQSLLFSRRQSLDASRAAIDAQGQAVRWETRLLIDAHLIWGLSRS
ncbi:TolC family protein, partial [Burkholderia sp. 4NA327C10]